MYQVLFKQYENYVIKLANNALMTANCFGIVSQRVIFFIIRYS